VGRGGEEGITSLAVIFSASHSIRGNIFARKVGLYSPSTCSSSVSRKWSGKEAGEDLQAFTAQVRKLAVRIFIFEGVKGRRWVELERERKIWLRWVGEDERRGFSLGEGVSELGLGGRAGGILGQILVVLGAWRILPAVMVDQYL